MSKESTNQPAEPVRPAATKTTRPRDRAILLFSCPDTRGIVAEVTHFIYTYGGNIIHSSQYNEPENDTFFMRIEWDLCDFSIPHERIRPAFEPIATKFGMKYRIEFSSHLTRMAILVSKYDHCLYDLLLRRLSGDFEADIAMVISNHETLKPVADYFHVPFHCIPVTAETKKEAEEQQLALMKDAGIDLVVLARYMQILSPAFINAYPDRIINIHHSFLPAFVGANPYKQAFERGVKIIGATSHYVTADLDQGPIIDQDVTRISHRDSVDALVRKGRDLEKLVLSRAVKSHLEHRVLVYGNKTVVFE